MFIIKSHFLIEFLIYVKDKNVKQIYLNKNQLTFGEMMIKERVRMKE